MLLKGCPQPFSSIVRGRVFFKVLCASRTASHLAGSLLCGKSSSSKRLSSSLSSTSSSSKCPSSSSSSKRLRSNTTMDAHKRIFPKVGKATTKQEWSDDDQTIECELFGGTKELQRQNASINGGKGLKANVSGSVLASC